MRADEHLRRIRRADVKRKRLRLLWRKETTDFAVLNEKAVADPEAGLTYTAIAEELGTDKETIRQMRVAYHVQMVREQGPGWVCPGCAGTDWTVQPGPKGATATAGQSVRPDAVVEEAS